MNHVQNASDQIANALQMLNQAKDHLLEARNYQFIPLDMTIYRLEKIYANLEDPKRTPEILEGMESDRKTTTSMQRE